MSINEVVALLTQLSRYMLALVGIFLCVSLFRRSQKFGWLLLSALFLEPFYICVARLILGRPVFRLHTMGDVTGGVQKITFHYDFPLFYILAVVGLFLLTREARQQENS